jgi:5'-AMP-activated protein kinase regulatory beta subunit
MSPPFSPMPGSPLTYSPQMVMEPIAKPEDIRGPDFHGISAWPAGPKLVPVVILCKFSFFYHHCTACLTRSNHLKCVFSSSGSHGGNHIEVEGSFDNWTTRQVLQRSGKDSSIVKLLPPGVYQVRNTGVKLQRNTTQPFPCFKYCPL